MTQPRVLLVDDERGITQSLASFMGRSGFHVDTAADGEEALRRTACFAPDLIVLDVLMPRMDGREVLRRLRRADDWTPVILLTRVGESTERAMALEEGADDYLNKPFDPHELVARTRAILRRARDGQASLAAAQRLCCGNLVLDRASYRAYVNGRELKRTPKASALLAYLMTHPDELLTRERLLDEVWGWDYPTGTRTVDTRIAELRRVLNDDPTQPRFIFLRTIIDQKGLDDPYPIQYTRWLVNFLRGDWGWSPTMHDDVLAGFLRRTPVTAELTVALVGTLVGAISGYAGGTLNAVKRCVSRFSGHSQRVPLSHNYGDGRRLGLWQFSPGCRNLASNTV